MSSKVLETADRLSHFSLSGFLASIFCTSDPCHLLLYQLILSMFVLNFLLFRWESGWGKLGFAGHICIHPNSTFYEFVVFTHIPWQLWSLQMEPIPDPGIKLMSLCLLPSATCEARMKSHWSLNALCMEQWLCTFNCSVFPSLDLFLLWNDFIEKLKSSVQTSCSVVSDSLQPHRLQHARPPCPSPTPGACSCSCPSCCWCHPTISSFVVPFSCLQSFPESGSFPMNQFFESGGQSIGVSASASIVQWIFTTDFL